MHDCDNRLCVNPLHLSLGTNRENLRDRYEKRRSARKLSDAQVREIRASSDTQANLARRFGVSQAMISKAMRGLHHGNVT
jgi:hypothetical protein